MTDGAHEVIADVSPRSVGPQTLYEMEEITAATIGQCASHADDIRDAKRALKKAGFTVFEAASNEVTLSIGGSAKLFKDFFGAKIGKQKADVLPGQPMEFMAPPEDEAGTVLEAPGELKDLIEGVTIPRPPTFFSPFSIPPLTQVASGAYPYLTVPDGVAVALRAARVHRLGVTGKDVVVAMPDTGQYAHPFFAERGYRLLPTLLGPGATEPTRDTNGHGTGESANVFACAPDVRLRPIKMGSDAAGAFNVAVNSTPKPKIITNSWGWTEFGTSLPAWLAPMAAAIASAVSQGIIVCFAGGNGPGRFFPASHPNVIAVGGVHVNLPNPNDFEASSYASSFTSGWYADRAVPDVCGLTGRSATIGGQVRAPSLMLPVEKGAQLDLITPPTGPEADGWGLFSGTSAACPQIAGICALIVERDPACTPAKAKSVLQRSARDVTKGTSAGGHTATTGRDAATGAGLADAKWAYLNTMGDVAATFFAAPKEEQLAMVSSGAMPAISQEFVKDMIDTLRSR